MPPTPGRLRPLLLNPGSGLRDLPSTELEARLPGFRVQEVPGPELVAALRREIDAGADVIAVAGGDGTIRTAAAELRGADIPLLALPGGTFNHFAKAVGIPDLDAACHAATEGVCETIDLGEVNGEVFINNASIGWYPAMVATRERWEQKVPRTLARLIALARHIPRVDRFHVEASGHAMAAWVVWVGNGRILTELGELGERADMSDGVLDVWVARADRRLPRTRLFVDLLRGRLATSSHVEHWTTTAMTLRVGRPTVRIALDGEVERLAAPLRFKVLAGALRVLVPPDSPVADSAEP